MGLKNDHILLPQNGATMVRIIYKQSFNVYIHNITFKDDNITFTIHPDNMSAYDRLRQMAAQYSQHYNAPLAPCGSTITTKAYVKSSGCFLTVDGPEVKDAHVVHATKELAHLDYWNSSKWNVIANTVARIIYDTKENIVELQIICYDYSIAYQPIQTKRYNLLKTIG